MFAWSYTKLTLEIILEHEVQKKVTTWLTVFYYWIILEQLLKTSLSLKSSDWLPLINNRATVTGWKWRAHRSWSCLLMKYLHICWAHCLKLFLIWVCIIWTASIWQNMEKVPLKKTIISFIYFLRLYYFFCEKKIFLIYYFYTKKRLQVISTWTRAEDTLCSQSEVSLF